MLDIKFAICEHLVMMKRTQKQIAAESRISAPYLSQSSTGKRVATYRVAKRIAELIGCDPIVFLEGTPEDIRAALSKTSIGANAKG